MPGISAHRTGHRAGRSGSLRNSLFLLALMPSLGLAAAWGFAAVLLAHTGHRTALLTGSAAVVALVVWSLLRGLRVARSVTARIDTLRTDALALAESEIPTIVARLKAGEHLPVPRPGAPRRTGGDELQQAADSLGAVRQTATAAIIRQAQGREGTKKVFLNIARRTQILIHRQISMLDSLEREHEEPELLKELFAVDHLATRMRRNAENLVILGGALPARRWRNAVPVVNVLRSAVSETENYSRVVVQGVPRTSLSGQAVADVIHLVAELIENGTTFSPPYTQVQVSAQEVPKGLAVEVEDRGLGMTQDEYERLNTYLANPPELDVAALGDDLRLGLFVVARLASRHEIQVALRPSPYGGTRAVVLIPAALLEKPEHSASLPGLPAGARVTRPPVPEGGEPLVFDSPLGGGAHDLDGGLGGGLTGALAGVLGGLLGGGGESAALERPEAVPAGPGVGDAGLGDAGLGDAGLSDAGFGGSGFGSSGFGGSGVGGGAPGGVRADDVLPDPALPDASPPDPAERNGGLPVGASIPGLPGAVVVPRPAAPPSFDTPTAPDADADAATGDADAPPAPAPSPAPTHERAREVTMAEEQDHDGELRTPRVLPQRIRNASLAEQLREANAPAPASPPSLSASHTEDRFGGRPTGRPEHGSGTARAHQQAEPDEDLAPQRSRATMAAIQRGTRSARETAPTAPEQGAPATPSASKDQQ
ncbi:sensor histidine kinase [Kitasatospora sp. NPDC050543]|uniref:sensor histidine kinase n=1 Tax=Kitasatospora sp. NPDC050543 TaxID=3364054 RepID=UPI0037886A2D